MSTSRPCRHIPFLLGRNLQDGVGWGGVLGGGGSRGEVARAGEYGGGGGGGGGGQGVVVPEGFANYSACVARAPGATSIVTSCAQTALVVFTHPMSIKQ